MGEDMFPLILFITNYEDMCNTGHFELILAYSILKFIFCRFEDYIVFSNLYNHFFLPRKTEDDVCKGKGGNSLNYMLDKPRFGKMFFQDPATSIFEKMVLLHHEILFYMFLLFILVLWFIVRINILCGKFPLDKGRFKSPVRWKVGKYSGIVVIGISLKRHYFRNFYKKKTIYKHEITLLEIL